MTRVLLTGTSGHVGAHVLEFLLARGHSVVATATSQQKAKLLKSNHQYVADDKLDTVVDDVAGPDAFDKAVISDPPFEAVIHTASHHRGIPSSVSLLDRGQDASNTVLEARLGRIGSTGILKAIQRNAPAVKRVVITSSFAGMSDPDEKAGKIYSELDWNPYTKAKLEASGSPGTKVFSEKAAWDFVATENPNFTLTACIAPRVLGPVLPSSRPANYPHIFYSELVRQATKGTAKTAHPPSTEFFVDVRDFALSHVLAVEKDEAAGKRFFIVADRYPIKQIMEIMDENFPHLRYQLPRGEALEPSSFPATVMADFDNRRSVEVLGMTYRSFTESIMDTVKSFKSLPVGPTHNTILSRKVRKDHGRRTFQQGPSYLRNPLLMPSSLVAPKQNSK